MYIKKAIDDFGFSYFSTSDLSIKTYNAYLCDLLQFQKYINRNIKLSSVTPELIEDWSKSLKNNNLSPATIQRKLSSLRVFFNYWVRKKRIKSSPLWQIRIKLGHSYTLPKTLSQKEIFTILKVANNEYQKCNLKNINTICKDFLKLRDLAIIETMFATGVRVGELVRLNLDDFIKEDRTIIIKGKGNKQRLAFLMENHCFEIILTYINKLKKYYLKIRLCL